MFFASADPHYFHWNINQYCGRGFSSVEEMNRTMVTRWNEVVTPKDTVFLLGDVGFADHDQLVDILKKLNGSKHLVIGNHDNKIRNLPALRHCFVNTDEIPEFPRIYMIKEITFHHREFVLSHFPLETWHGQHRGPRAKIHLHGHCHGNLARQHTIPNRWDVGVDCSARYGFKPFAPIPLDYFIKNFDPTPPSEVGK